MNICAMFWKWLMFAALPLYMHDESDTAQNSTTENNNISTDKRLVTDGGSTGVSADNSTVSIYSNDLGAIEKAFNFAATSNKQNSDDFSKVINIIGDSLTFAKETSKLSSTTQKNALDQVAAAQSNIQENITGNKHLVTLGLIIAGVVGLAAFGGKIKL